jgi:hypothetical protein
MCHVLLAEQDSLLYPELLRTDFEENTESEGTASFRLSFEDQIKFQTKTLFVYKGFKLNYRNRGEGDQNIEQRTSLSYTWKGLSIGYGRGYVNIAHGIILGYSMMKYSPAFSGQAGIRPVKMKIGAYDQNKDLITLGISVKSIGIFLFRFDDTFGGTVEYNKDHGRYGLALYLAVKPIMESWASLENNSFKTSLNMSTTHRGINHLSADILYKTNKIRLFGSAVWLSPEFVDLKKDSKWGSGLSPGSRGLTAGIRIGRAPWRFSGLGQSILGNTYREEKSILDLRFKQHPFEINSVYSLTIKNKLDEGDNFPFLLTWQKNIKHNMKVNVKIKVTKTCRLTCQLQGDFIHERSYISLFRLDYKGDLSSIKFQLTRCAGFDNDLYFVRPAGVTYYGIRKAPNDETLFIDLIYAINIARFDVYIHLRNEGVSMGINYK